MNTSFYYGLLVGGGEIALVGIGMVILAIKFIQINRKSSITTGLFFFLAGVGIFWLTIMTPSPTSQAASRIEMLDLDSQYITTLSFYSDDDLEQVVAQVDDSAMLQEWAEILKSCQEFQPNHPHYENSYRLALKYNGSELLYDVGFDSKNLNTADLTLLAKDKFQAGYYILGNYRCDGLFAFVAKILN